MNHQHQTIKRILVAAMAGVVLVVTATATALPAGTETDRSGAVSATLSWDAGPGGSSIDHARLAIRRNAKVALNHAIPDVLCDGCELATVARGARPKGDLRVSDLDRDGEPEVVVEGFSGGVECCVTVGIYDFRPASGTYGELLETFHSGDFLTADVDHDGRPELISHDQRFVGLFGDPRDAWPPPLVQHYARPDGRPGLVDVTRHFPAVIGRDARRARATFNRTDRHDVDVPAVLAGYVADEFLLGKRSAAIHTLDRQIARGFLGSPKRAHAYRARLLKVLHTLGYR